MEIPFSILSPESDRQPSPVAQIKEQIDTLLALLAQQEEDLREARIMLQRANTEVILYGKVPPPDYTASLGGEFESTRFIVVALDLRNREQLFQGNENNKFSAREVELMKTAIYHVFETALGPLCVAACCESDMAFANILINLLDEDPPETLVYQNISQALESAITLVAQNYGIDLVAEMSQIVSGFENLPNARLEAYHKLQRKYALEPMAHTNLIIPAEKSASRLTSQPNAKMEKQYYQCILGRDLDAAYRTLRELTQKDLETEGMHFEAVKLRLMNHVESLLNVYGLASTDFGYLYLRPLDSAEAVFRLLEELFRDVQEQISSANQAQQSKIEAIASYIEENYSDCNLCLAKLCDLFDMNQSSLSRSFKYVHGTGVLDYIHHQRMLHVKEMLRNSNVNIDTIWKSAGYTNRRTFNRTFRKLEGMSASEYRKLIDRQGEHGIDNMSK